MPRIEPFFALRPNPLKQKQVITWPLDYYSEGQARLILDENPYSFLHLVNPALDHPYLRGPRQDLLYKKISENLDSFIENGVLVFDKIPGIYIYRVHTELGVFTGLWTLTAINAYLNGEVKKHELTVSRREKQLSEYLANSHIDANPVLIAYPENQIIDSLILKYTESESPVCNYISEDNHKHLIWAITKQEDIQLIKETFEDIESVYIADGHHRAAAMASMALQRRHLYGEDENLNFNFFNTAYFSSKELKILAFHRLVKDLGGLSKDEFFACLSELFLVTKESNAYIPSKKGIFGLYWEKQWYSLELKESFYKELLKRNSPVELLDVSILHTYLLDAKLHISDPRSDARVRYEGGNVDISKLVEQVDNRNYSLLFTLFPSSIDEIMSVADADQTMPPKSTWIAPKFRLGLLSHYYLKSMS